MPIPNVTEVVDKIEMKNKIVYQPTRYENNGSFTHEKVKNEIITKVETIDERQGIDSEITSLEITDLKTATLITSKTGKGFLPFDYKDTGNKAWSDACGCYLDWSKWTFGYYTPINIYWRGEVIEEKKITLTGKATLDIGEETSLAAAVSTLSPGQVDFSAPVNISYAADWRTDKQSVVSLVGSSGKVKGVSPGTATVTAVWRKQETPNDEGYVLTASLTLTVQDGGCMGDCGPPPAPGGGCTAPVPGDSVTGSVMDPSATAVIRADPRGQERFDVLQGIPTSESLYGNVMARSYLYQNEFVNMHGTCTYTVPVTQPYLLQWDEEENGPPDASGKPTTITVRKQRSETVTQEYTVERPYAYWVIGKLEVYQLQEAELMNYALSGGTMTLRPAGYTPPSYAAATAGEHLLEPSINAVTLPLKTVAGEQVPAEDFTAYAEEAVTPVKVRNDHLTFNQSLILDSSLVEESGPAPSALPAPGWVHPDVLYSPNHVISADKINRSRAPSQGTLAYQRMPVQIQGSGVDPVFPISSINPVTIHTPVVLYASVSDDQAHNQKTEPHPTRAAFILDRPFTVRIPTSGQHLEASSYPGYGNRDYARYVRSKQVRFPFDVYQADRSTFIPKHTWIDIPVHQLDTEFFLPVWVDEGEYEVYFRTLAENAPADYSWEREANLHLSHHAAVDEVSVDVIGRLYDFKVTDIADYTWETVFRTAKGSREHTGKVYWTGLQHLDGGSRGNVLPYTLPIAPGKHPQAGYANAAVKTGYHFKFDVKTKGNLFGSSDGIAITPRFDFVHLDGRGRQPVDLYYHRGKEYFIPIGSPQDTVKREITLNTRLRNVPLQELLDTAAYQYQRGPQGEALQPYTSRYLQQVSTEKTWIGRYDWLLLPSQLRTLIGPKADLPPTVDPYRASAAIQRWYGEYSLPAEVYAVPQGTSLPEYARRYGLDEQSDLFLKEGYIIVNFDLESVRNGDLAHPHLQYIHAPHMNQWRLEGFQDSIRNPAGQRFPLLDGDVLFYHGDLGSRQDFESHVPH
ncbi:DUF5704 domain-containing protein [Paenibacillus sp. JSM ZJ436]